MPQPDLSAESHVLLLLATYLGGQEDAENTERGLGPAGWHDFAAAVGDSSLDSPGVLLSLEPDEWPADIWTDQIERSWAAERLGRSTRLAMTLEDLNSRGIWVTTQYEPSYPDSLNESLGRKAPPSLFVAGQPELLGSAAVGFVGSRDVDEADREYTRGLVEKVMDEGYGIVSGGAKGIDETSEQAGLERGGPVVEFPAEGLVSCLEDETVRDAVIEGQLALASPYHPEMSWNVGAAMGRNKLIHGFGSYTVAVRSGEESGGTWAGSTENIDHGWSELVVCAQTDAEAGNRALVERGGTPIDPTAIPVVRSFEEWVRANGQRASDSEEDDDGSTTERASSVDSEKVQSSLEKFE